MERDEVTQVRLVLDNQDASARSIGGISSTPTIPV
jgi:hypothetical protein